MTTLMDRAVDVGTTKRLNLDFGTLGSPSSPVDPATVSVTLRDPHGSKYSVTALRESDGNWYAQFTVPVAGQWRWRCETLNPVRTLEGSFVVRRSEIAERTVQDGLPTRFKTV